MTAHLPVNFSRPPVTEVVFGVGFPEIEGLASAHVGMLWQRWMGDYPQTQDVAPAPPMSDESVNQPSIRVDLIQGMPRVWFTSGDGRGLLQVQNNRFHYNWRKVTPEDVYPRFPAIFTEFKRRLGEFESFLAEGGQPLSLAHAELAYVNHVPLSDGPEGPEHVGAILPHMAWTERAGGTLPPPVHLSWDARFPLPNDRALRCAARVLRDVNTGGRVLALDMTVRGQIDEAGLDPWFLAAHDSIVSAFVELTAEQAQQDRWGRDGGGSP